MQMKNKLIFLLAIIFVVLQVNINFINICDRKNISKNFSVQKNICVPMTVTKENPPSSFVHR